MGVAIGIDLGTSNSCVAAVRDGEPVVFADAEGRGSPQVSDEGMEFRGNARGFLLPHRQAVHGDPPRAALPPGAKPR
jgi:molecular chaperone DnaK (HSP70)